MLIRTVTCLVFISLLAGPAWAQDRQPVSDESRPMTPGIHLLTFDFEYGQKTASMPYGLYLPKQVADLKLTQKKLPLIVFLYGKGSIGQTYDKLFRNGPMAEIKRRKGFEDSVNFAILAPMVPTGDRWENERMGHYVAEATRRVIQRWPIDPDRVYLVGMSMGGEGVWHAALAAPQLYRVIAAIGGRQHPDPDRVAAALKDQTILIVTGSVDKDFTTGSQAMSQAFDKVKADKLYIELPGRGHDIWGFYMPRPAFYQWILKHEHGKPAPADRETQEQIAKWATKKPGDPAYNDFAEKLQVQFDKFKPHWFIENCPNRDDVRLHDQLMGRKRVFVTRPLNYAIGARIMSTVAIPAGKQTKLVLEVASEAEERFRLMVAVDSYPSLNEIVRNSGRSDDPWRTYEIDLTKFAGQKVFIEILHKRHGKSAGFAAWSKIEVVSEPLPENATPAGNDSQN